MSLEDSRSVEINRHGQTSIRLTAVLDELYRESLPVGSFADYLSQLEGYVREVAQAKGLRLPTTNALSNVRGTWFEIIVAVKTWNYLTQYAPPDIFVLKLPSVTSFNFRKIFKPDTQAILQQLEESLQRSEPPVSLVTSNPDLMIIQEKNVILDWRPINNLSQMEVARIMSMYLRVEGAVTWNSLKAGIGLKTSLRPDRRLQLVHEGNIIKSLYAHLKMRYWDNKTRLGYYVISTDSLNNANDLALRTATTHSIINVDSRPERAVDEIFSASSIDDIEPIIARIISNHID